jgi:hypothetical protein
MTHFGQVEVVNSSRPVAGACAVSGAFFVSSSTAEGAAAGAAAAGWSKVTF